jgi:hypothetical protein
MIVISAGLNVGMMSLLIARQGLALRLSQIASSSIIMVESGPDESILHKRRINLHKIGEDSSHLSLPQSHNG